MVYYIAHPESVKQVQDAYETYYMEMEYCGTTIIVDLVQCFPKWANINGDTDANGKAIIDDKDVVALKQLVR